MVHSTHVNVFYYIQYLKIEKISESTFIPEILTTLSKKKKIVYRVVSRIHTFGYEQQSNRIKYSKFEFTNAEKIYFIKKRIIKK